MKKCQSQVIPFYFSLQPQLWWRFSWYLIFVINIAKIGRKIHTDLGCKVAMTVAVTHACAWPTCISIFNLLNVVVFTWNSIFKLSDIVWFSRFNKNRTAFAVWMAKKRGTAEARIINGNSWIIHGNSCLKKAIIYLPPTRPRRGLISVPSCRLISIFNLHNVVVLHETRFLYYRT